MKEEEIRPKAISDEYLRLADFDTQLYFSKVERTYINCPACGGVGEPAINKSRFVYDKCPECQTLYVNPRPVAEAFSSYYRDAPSSLYWATTFYKETAKARKEKLWKPKAEQIMGIIASFCASSNPVVVDVGGGYGIFAEVINDILVEAPVIIEPAPHLAQICRDKGLMVVEKFLEDVKVDDLPLAPKVFVSFELFEHLTDPSLFMESMNSLMSSGDIFIFTTLSGTGVDIQALWEDSKSVFPPHHLNFFNPKSIKLLVESAGFESLQITTPGKPDIDILDNNRALIKDRFWRTFVETATEYEKSVWQEWIADQGWSSHMWSVSRKP